MLFQFTNMSDLGNFFAGLFAFQNFGASTDATYQILSHLPLLIIGFIACLPVARNLFEKWKDKKGFIVLESILIICALVLCTSALVTSTYNPFLYFRF